MDWREYKNVKDKTDSDISAVVDGEEVVIIKVDFDKDTGKALPDVVLRVRKEQIEQEQEHAQNELDRATQTKEAAIEILNDI